MSGPVALTCGSAGCGVMLDGSAFGLVGTGTTDSDGSPISATVDFSLTGSTFQIVLTHNNVANSQASVLTNVGFNAVPTPAAVLPSASGSASITAGSLKVALGIPDSHTAGQEWAYLTGGAASSGFGHPQNLPLRASGDRGRATYEGSARIL